MLKSIIHICIIVLCSLHFFSPLALATDNIPSPAWGGKKVKRTYSSSETQKIFEQQLLERIDETETELETEPLLDAGEADGEEVPAFAPTRSVPKQRENIKHYGFQPEHQHAQTLSPPPFNRPAELKDSVVETELKTEPIYEEDEWQPATHNKLYSVKARLDRARVHLDESFSLIVEAMVLDLDRLGAFQLPRIKEFNLINEYQAETNTTAEGRVWWVRTKQYVFVARKPGQYSIPPVAIFYAGKKYYTRRLIINVEGSRSGICYSRPASGEVYKQNEIIPSAPDVGRARKEKVEFFAEISAPRVFVNQQVILTVRLQYTSDDQTTMSYRPPRLTGFLTEVLPESKSEDRISGAKQSFIEMQYRTALFPVRAGSLTVDVAEVVFTRKSKKQSYLTEPLTLEVVPLPEDTRPLTKVQQNGLVGQYQLRAEVDTQNTEVDRPINLVIVLTGKGNLRSAPEPFIPAAQHYRIYLEDRKEQVYTKTEGIEGERIYKYLVVFDKPGKMGLGKASIRYFDPDKKHWKTVTARIPEIQVTLRKDQPIQVQPDGKPDYFLDLKPNHGGAAILTPPKPWVAATLSFWLLQALGPVLIGVVLLGKRWRAQALKDAEVNRIRRAYATAQKSLRQLKRYMQKREDKKFYDGLAKTTSDYLATKFEIPNVYIGTERIPEYFEQYQVPTKLQQRLKAALTACEYVRYAAAVLPDKDMWALYRDVKAAIRDFEKFWVQKNRQKQSHHTKVIILLGLILLASSSYAGEAELHFWRGNTQAERGDHAAAEREYRHVLSLEIEDPDVYYNLGNTYLQQGKLGAAILSYERGLRLAPRDPDLRFNLRQAETLVGENYTERKQPGWGNTIVRLYQSVTPNETAWAASFFYFLAVCLIILILLWPARFRQGWLVVWILVGIAAGMALWSGLRCFEPRWRKQAVVMTAQSEIYSRPYTNAEVLFSIPEGTRVVIKQEEEAWVEVFCAPGRRGWAKRSTLGFIE